MQINVRNRETHKFKELLVGDVFEFAQNREVFYMMVLNGGSKAVMCLDDYEICSTEFYVPEDKVTIMHSILDLEYPF